jgi:hypothetical protein
LRRADGAFLRVDAGERGGELRVAIFFAAGGVVNRGVLSGERGGEMLRVASRTAPGAGDERERGQRGGEHGEMERGFHGVRLVLFFLTFRFARTVFVAQASACEIFACAAKSKKNTG